MKSTINVNQRESFGNIEMPPLDQIASIANALENDQTPVVGQQKQAQQQQFNQDVMVESSLDALPQYEPDYNPQEVEVPQYEQPVQKAQQAQPESKIKSERQEEESAQARNFRELRMQAAQAAKERDELLAYIKHIETQKASPVIQESELDIDLDEDDMITGKQMKQVLNQVKGIKKQLQQTQKQSEEVKKISYEAEVERTMRRMYPDFDQVVSEENIQRFKEQFGSLATSISNDPDFYNKCNSVYMAIKNTGVAKPMPYQQQVDKIKQNASKPRPLTSISPQQADSPLARANAFAEGLTPDMQKQLYQEMINARKNI